MSGDQLSSDDDGEDFELFYADVKSTTDHPDEPRDAHPAPGPSKGGVSVDSLSRKEGSSGEAPKKEAVNATDDSRASRTSKHPPTDFSDDDSSSEGEANCSPLRTAKEEGVSVQVETGPPSSEGHAGATDETVFTMTTREFSCPPFPGFDRFMRRA